MESASSWVGRYVATEQKLRKRTGVVHTVVQEHYLRDDMPCRSALCTTCQQEDCHLAANAAHYVVPDAEALHSYLEILELPQVTGVIYLASALKQVSDRASQRTLRKLRSLYRDRRRQSSFFDDQHFLLTWLLLQDAAMAASGTAASETSGNQEAVVVAARWFADHLDHQIPVIVLSDSSADVGSGTTGQVAGRDPIDELLEEFHDTVQVSPHKEVQILTGKEYFRRFWLQDSEVFGLFQSLEQAQLPATLLEGQTAPSAKAGVPGVPAYARHLSARAIEEGIEKGSIQTGTFQVSIRDSSQAFVQWSAKEGSRVAARIPSKALQNRAMDGDRVAVRLLPRNRWHAEGHQLDTLQESQGQSNDRWQSREGDEEEVLDPSPEEAGGTRGRFDAPLGEVVGILQRAQREVVCCLEQEDEAALSGGGSARDQALLCVPRRRVIPKIRVRTRQAGLLAAQRFVVRIDSWDRNSAFPHGHLVRQIGPIGDLEAESTALLLEHGIVDHPFSAGALEELPKVGSGQAWKVPVHEVAARRDLRASHRTCSIDPPGSKDVDDALSICPLPNGLVEVGVHIADVSFFVPPGSLLDTEAQSRATTVYLVDRRLDMLPALLSEDLCSLLGGRDRLAMSVIWTVDPASGFSVVDTWLGRTVIHSRHQMSYAQAQAILDGSDPPDGRHLSGGKEEAARVGADLALISNFSERLKAKRTADGALELASSELRFDIGTEDESGKQTKQPLRVHAKEELPMMGIVAEMMIFANSTVARCIYKGLPAGALLRRHAPPRLDGFFHLLELCNSRGFALDTSSNKALAASLHRWRESGDPVVEMAVKALATRAMSEAEYFSTGAFAEREAFFHYGLALEFYTHFTSPIRRYADIVVHLQLAAALNMPPVPPPGQSRLLELQLHPDLQELAEHLNERHRASKRAQKDCCQLYLLLFLANHARAERAVVVGIEETAVVVFIPKYDLRGLLHLQDKKGHVVLPAENDELEKDPQLVTPPAIRRQLSLRKLPNSLSIQDAEGRTLAGYALLQSLWVELRADASRAHMPTLRIRALAATHPAARAAAQALPAAPPIHRSRAEVAAREWGERALAEAKQAKVETLGPAVAELDKERSAPDGIGSNSEWGRSTRRVLEEFRQARVDATALFLASSSQLAGPLVPELDRQRNSGSISSPEAQEDESCHTELLEVPYACQVAPIQVALESDVGAGRRRLWESRLARASKQKARRLRSALCDEDPKQQRREELETLARWRSEQAFQAWALSLTREGRAAK